MAIQSFSNDSHIFIVIISVVDFLYMFLSNMKFYNFMSTW